jgi:hypothetical protein
MLILNMGRISKTFAISLTLLVATSCLIMPAVEPAKGQTIPKPSVPEFTLKYIDNDNIENRTIDVIIENQPFTPTLLSNGNITELRYDVVAENRFNPIIKVLEKLPLQDSSSASNQTVVTRGGLGVWQIDGKINFKVKAEVGYRTYDANAKPGVYGFIAIEQSDWSPTQTISIPDGAVTIANSPTPSPPVPELPLIAVFSLFVVIALITIFYKKENVPKRL